jgi:hypothetical protein
MNYKQEIQRLMQRVPSAVIHGSTNQAIAYKIAVEKAIAVTSKSRPSESELMSALSQLQVFEQGTKQNEA